MIVCRVYIAPSPHLREPLQLFYKTGRVRVVISTANLIAYDWRDMENVKPSLWTKPLYPHLVAERLAPRHPTEEQACPT